MGILDTDSFMHGASGKIGGIVLYTVDGKTYFRQHVPQHADARTEKQLLQRQRLITAQTLFQSVKNCLLYDVFSLAAVQQHRRSGYHLFLKLNTTACGKDYTIDYSLLTFSQGQLQLPFNFRLSGSNDRQAEFTWSNCQEQTTARGSDRLQVAAIFPDEPFRVKILPGIDAVRKDGYATVPLEKRPGGEVHLYCFFARSDLKSFSDNRYFCINR